jgi:hypothetical protein
MRESPDLGLRRRSNIQRTFREHPGNIQGTSREHLGNIQGTFREHSGNFQGRIGRESPHLGLRIHVHADVATLRVRTRHRKVSKDIMHVVEPVDQAPLRLQGTFRER